MSEGTIGLIMLYVCSVAVSVILHTCFRRRAFGFLRACFWATLVGPVLFLLLAHIISGPEAFLPIAFVVSILYTFFVPPLVGIFMSGLTQALGRTPSCKHEEAEGKGATGSAASRSSGRPGVSVAYTTYPNITRGLKAGLIGGGFVGLLWFLVRCWAASLSAPTPVSLSLAFRPWRQNWPGALVVFAAGFIVIGALAALRPDLGRHGQKQVGHVRRTILFLLVLCLCAFAFVGLLWTNINHFLLTGRLFPIEKIDVLEHPAAVIGWSEDELLLENGETVLLPGRTGLPLKCRALAEATKRGVEVGEDGRVYGLVRIHHGCGNDPVGEHIARVDIAQMLEFLGEGEPLRPDIDEERMPLHRKGGSFSQFGWRVGEYATFRTWAEIMREGARPRSRRRGRKP